MQNILEKFNEILSDVTSRKNELEELLNASANLNLEAISSLPNYDENNFFYFCEEEDEIWSEFLHEHGLEVVYIGRTNTFHLNSKHFDMYRNDYHGNITISNLVNLICEYSGMDSDYIKINKDGKIVDLEDVELSDGNIVGWTEYFLKNLTIEDYYNDLELMVSSFLEEIKEIKAGYDYLENSIKTQVERYNDFVEAV